VWQVKLKDQVVYMTDDEDAARAKAHRLNRKAPAYVHYKVEEVQDEQIPQQKGDD